MESAAAEVLAQVATLLRARRRRRSADDSDMLAAGGRSAACGPGWPPPMPLSPTWRVAPLLAQPRGPESGGTDAVSSIRDIDPGFPVRMVAFAVEQLTDVALDALGIRRRDASLPDRWSATVRSYSPVAAGHLTARSVWFRNSLRGAVALAIAVAVAEATTVQHGFWVVLGTLSVLRSNALGTGSTAVRAVVGTALGFVLGSAILVALSTHDDVPVGGPAVRRPGGRHRPVGHLLHRRSGRIHRAGGRGLQHHRSGGIVDRPGTDRGRGHRDRGRAWWSGCCSGPGGPRPSWPGHSCRATRRPPAGWSPPSTMSAGRTRPVTALRTGDGRRPPPSDWTTPTGEFLSERGAKQVPLAAVTHLLTGCAAIRLSARTLEHLPVLAAPGGATTHRRGRGGPGDGHGVVPVDGGVVLRGGRQPRRQVTRGCRPGTR